MNSTTSTRLGPLCLTAAAAAVATSLVLLGTPAMATTDLLSGTCASDDSSGLDISQYIDQLKADWAQDRVDRFRLYR